MTLFSCFITISIIFFYKVGQNNFRIQTIINTWILIELVKIIFETSFEILIRIFPRRHRISFISDILIFTVPGSIESVKLLI